MSQIYDNWLFLSHSTDCMSSLFIWRHVGTQRLFIVSLCVRKGTYSILASLLWRIQETGRKKWNSFLLFVVGKMFSFQQLVFSNSHLKMVRLFSLEISLTLKTETYEEAKGVEHKWFEQREFLFKFAFSLWFISHYGQIWKYFEILMKHSMYFFIVVIQEL